MKKLIYFAMIALFVVTVFTIIGGNSDEDYIVATLEIRNGKIEFLKNSSQSPFKQFEIEYRAPNYFEIDPAYNVRAKLQRISDPQRVILKNSDGTSSSYFKFAYAIFKLKEKEEQQLLILKPVGLGSINKYFTAFADKTSGSITYGGGRYLDLEIGKSDHIMIDFNLAYNPYCAYAPNYSCPFPPAENILDIAIEAGEKDYKY